MDLQGLTSICLGHESTSTGANSGVQRASIVAGFGDGRVSVYREFEYGASAESMFYACPGSNKPVSAVATSPASCIAGSDFEAVVLSGTTGEWDVAHAAMQGPTCVLWPLACSSSYAHKPPLGLEHVRM
jgi:hypothetical protein